MDTCKTLLSFLPLSSTAEDISELTDRDLWKLLHGDDVRNSRTTRTTAELSTLPSNDTIPTPKGLPELLPVHSIGRFDCESSSLVSPQLCTTVGGSPAGVETNIDENNASGARTGFSSMVSFCDATVLRNERKRRGHSVQEAWLHRGLHHHRWDEALLCRGSSYRTNSIASRTMFGMSHTKSLCISLNMDTSLLDTTDVVIPSFAEDSAAGHCVKAQTEAGVWTSNDMDSAASRIVPLFMWQSPQSMPSDADSILPQLSEQLKEQYHTLASRPLITTSCLNQRAVDLGQALDKARKEAGTSKVIFHYYARGVPKARNGNIFLMNFLSSASSCPPLSNMSLDTLRARVGFPLVFIADCANAGAILEDFILKREEQEQQHQFLSREHQLVLSGSRPVSSADLDTMVDGGKGVSVSTMNYTAPKLGGAGLPHAPTVSSLSTTATVFDDFFFIGASGCGGSQGALSQHDRLPSDILTSCLTTPLRLAMTWFMVKRHDLIDVHPILLEVLPGSLQDKKTPLGQLQWYFQCITECIAWSSFPLSTFSRLFREDIYVAPLFRGYLLAEHVIVGGLGGTMSVYPRLTPTHDHPIWDSWENLLERSFVAVLKLVRPAPPTCLTTLEFREWLDVRATKWKYTQDGVSTQLHGTALPRLPILDETRPLTLPDFLLEEFQGLDAIIEQVTAQSFCMPITGKKRLTPHTHEMNHFTNKWNSQALQKGINSNAGSARIFSAHNPIPNSSARWKHFQYENQSLRYLKRKPWQRGSQDYIESVDYSKHKYWYEPPGASMPLLSPFSHHLGIKAAEHADDSNVTLSTKSYSIAATSKPFSVAAGSASVTPAVEYVGNMWASSSANNTLASGVPTPFPFIKRMPIILQGLLVMAYRERATALVCRLVDAGAPAILQCAEANIYRVVLDHYWKRPDLRFLMPTTLFIYSKSYYVDPGLVGPSGQCSSVIKACVEVLQCPIKVHGANTTGSFSAAECATTAGLESGAWQWKLLGFYSTPRGQRLLACSILAMLAIHSDDARDACHRYGAFQLVCQLLEEVYLHDDINDLLPSAPQQQQQDQKHNQTHLSPSLAYTFDLPHMRVKYDPTCDNFDSFQKKQSPMTLHNVDWRTVTTLYRMALMALFVALLHNWSPPPDKEDEGRTVNDDTEMAHNSLEDIEEKQGSLKSTNASNLKEGLQVALGALEQTLYSSIPVLRGTALRALSIIVISPATDVATKRRFAASLLSQLSSASSLRFEGNTDLRLEVVGVALVVYKFLLEEASKDMSQDEIRSYVTQWLYKYDAVQFVRQKETEKDSDVENADSLGCLPRPASKHAAMAGIHPHGIPSLPSKPPTSVSFSKSRLSFGGVPPESRNPQGVYNPHNNHSFKVNIAPSASLIEESLRISEPPFTKPGHSVLESQVLFPLSNLVRFVVELTHDPCPYVAAHACKVALEEMAFLLEDAPPSLVDIGTAVESTVFSHSVDTCEGPGGTYRAQGSRSRSAVQKTRSSLAHVYHQQNPYNSSAVTSMNYLENDTDDTISTDKPRRHNTAKLFYKSMDKVKKMRKQVHHTVGTGGNKPDNEENGTQYCDNSSDENNRLKPQPPLSNYTTSRDCFQGSDAEANANNSNAIYSAMLPENITLRALSAQDNTTVSMFVYTSLSYIGDLLLIKPDDYDPRNPFSQQSESYLHAYMLVLAREISGDVLQPATELLRATSGYLEGEKQEKERHASTNVDLCDNSACSNRTKNVHSKQEATSEGSFRVKLLGTNTVSRSTTEVGRIQRFLFHPIIPDFIASTDCGVIQCWDYSAALTANSGGLETSNQPSVDLLRMTACFKTDTVLARPLSVVPRGAQLQHTFSSTPWNSSVDSECLRVGDEVAVNNFGFPFTNGSSLPHSRSCIDPIDGIHFVDVAYQPLLCAVHRTGVVELFSGYKNNGTVRRVSTFCTSSSLSTFDFANPSFPTPITPSALSPGHGCLSSYQDQSKLLYLCNSGDEDPAVMSWDLSCERVTLRGYGCGEYLLGPPSVLASHPYDDSLFAVGAATSIHLYDRRRPGPKAVEQLDFSSTVYIKDIPWRCSHTHFSCRFANLIVSGFQSQQRYSVPEVSSSFLSKPSSSCAALVLWDNRYSKYPLNVYYHKPHTTSAGDSYMGESSHEFPDSNMALAPSVIDVQPFSRRLRSLIIDEDGVTLAEWGLHPNPTRSQRFSGLNHALSAARLHPFLPHIALCRGSQVMLLGDNRRA
ncbi:unnamed protein product [Phytomonas sp. EM1]|nr:unnamed protein product [Phytomonas sp. EM1]|eukprot:CCW64470.1 unnamed protein product [Phytomonas sp. isolate EM1]